MAFMKALDGVCCTVAIEKQILDSEGRAAFANRWTMRGNEARRPIQEDQTRENPMEARVAVIETDVRHVKENIAKLSDAVGKLSDAVTKLLAGQVELRRDMNTLRAETLRAEIGTRFAEIGTRFAEMGTRCAEMDGRMEALEKKIVKWFFATAFSCAGLAFSATKLFG
jgi:chromosome segregation ATPase